MAERKNDLAKEVEREHEGIHRHITELQAMAIQETSAADFSNWRLQFMWNIRDFKNRLLKHFDLEEEGGFMHDVLRAAPHSQRQIKQLKKEHEQIANDLDQVLRHLKKMERKDPEKLETIRANLEQIVTTIHEHENQEHILMQRAYYRDYGEQD